MLNASLPRLVQHKSANIHRDVYLGELPHRWQRHVSYSFFRQGIFLQHSTYVAYLRPSSLLKSPGELRWGRSKDGLLPTLYLSAIIVKALSMSRMRKDYFDVWWHGFAK